MMSFAFFSRKSCLKPPSPQLHMFKPPRTSPPIRMPILTLNISVLESNIRMASDQSQLALVLGLIYACGAVLELFIRISQGVPHSLPPRFERNIFLVLIVFFLLPTLLWPFVCLYRIMAPIIRLILECARPKVDSISSDDLDSVSEDKPDAAHDVEKGRDL